MKSQESDREGPREPFGVAKISENLCNGFPANSHRAIRHQQMNRCVSIPNTQMPIQACKRFGIITDRAYIDADLASGAVRRCLNPLADRAAYGALVVVEKDRSGLQVVQWTERADANARVIVVMRLATVGCGPSMRPISSPFKNMSSVGVA